MHEQPADKRILGRMQQIFALPFVDDLLQPEKLAENIRRATELGYRVRLIGLETGSVTVWVSSADQTRRSLGHVDPVDQNASRCLGHALVDAADQEPRYVPVVTAGGVKEDIVNTAKAAAPRALDIIIRLMESDGKFSSRLEACKTVLRIAGLEQPKVVKLEAGSDSGTHIEDLLNAAPEKLRQEFARVVDLLEANYNAREAKKVMAAAKAAEERIGQFAN